MECLCAGRAECRPRDGMAIVEQRLVESRSRAGAQVGAELDCDNGSSYADQVSELLGSVALSEQHHRDKRTDDRLTEFNSSRLASGRDVLCATGRVRLSGD